MINGWRRAAFAVGMTLSASNASAELVKAVVVYNKGCNDRFVVRTTIGLTLIQSYSVRVPTEGSTLIGDFNTYGFVDFYDLNADQNGRGYVDDYMLSTDRMVEKLRDKCS